MPNCKIYDIVYNLLINNWAQRHPFENKSVILQIEIGV